MLVDVADLDVSDLDVSDLDVSDLDVSDLDVSDIDVSDAEVGALVRGLKRAKLARATGGGRGRTMIDPQKLARAMQHAAPLRMRVSDPVHGTKIPLSDTPISQQRTRTYSLPFFFGGIPANAVQPVSQQPQVEFIPNRLVIDDITGANFRITDLSVGKDRMLAAVGTQSAAVYGPNSFHSGFLWNLAKVSQLITISVQNITLGPADFTASLFGVASE